MDRSGGQLAAEKETTHPKRRGRAAGPGRAASDGAWRVWGVARQWALDPRTGRWGPVEASDVLTARERSGHRSSGPDAATTPQRTRARRRLTGGRAAAVSS